MPKFFLISQIIITESNWRFLFTEKTRRKKPFVLKILPRNAEGKGCLNTCQPKPKLPLKKWTKGVIQTLKAIWSSSYTEVMAQDAEGAVVNAWRYHNAHVKIYF